MMRSDLKLIVLFISLAIQINCNGINNSKQTDLPALNIGNYKSVIASNGDSTVILSDSLFLMGIIVDSNSITIMDGIAINSRGCYSLRKIDYNNPDLDTLSFGPDGSWYRSGQIIFRGDSITLKTDDAYEIVIYDFVKIDGAIPPAGWPDSICNE